MKFHVSIPRKIAEDDEPKVEVDAATVEDAILEACRLWGMGKPSSGDRFHVWTRVEIVPRSALPLRSY